MGTKKKLPGMPGAVNSFYVFYQLHTTIHDCPRLFVFTTTSDKTVMIVGKNCVHNSVTKIKA